MKKSGIRGLKEPLKTLFLSISEDSAFDNSLHEGTARRILKYGFAVFDYKNGSNSIFIAFIIKNYFNTVSTFYLGLSLSIFKFGLNSRLCSLTTQWSSLRSGGKNVISFTFIGTGPEHEAVPHRRRSLFCTWDMSQQEICRF